MKVQLERTYQIDASPEHAWAMLADIEAVAACMPGARITERIDERRFQGTVTVKLGPATLAFRGAFEIREHDAERRTLRLIAKGTDSTGSSAASLDLTARIEAGTAGSAASALLGAFEASVNGRAAAFGGRMMEAVADQILLQFVANFSARVHTQQPPQDAGPQAPSPAPAAQLSRPDGLAGPATPQPLNGLALLWAALRSWLRGLLSGKTS